MLARRTRTSRRRASSTVPSTIASCSSSISKRSPVGGNGMPNAACSLVVPAGAEPELDAAAAHRVGLRDLDRERPGQAERDRRDERAEPDARRLAAERGERHPRVGRARARRSLADAEVVVGPEERVEAELLGELRDREQLVVGRALLGFGEDPQFHGRRRYPHALGCVVGDGAVRGYAARVLSVEHWPELTEPLLVVALTGWVDAGRRRRRRDGRARRAARGRRDVRHDRHLRRSPTSSRPARSPGGRTTAA